MNKSILNLFSIIFLVWLTSLLVSCSQENQVRPVSTNCSGAREGIDVQPLAGDPNATGNRGRIQIQGNDMTQGEVSWPWSRETNYVVSKSEAVLQLDDLYNNLTTRQREDRNEAYVKAKNFIMAGPYTIAGTAIIRSFRNNNPRDPSTRIDIEIRTGTAFN